MQTMRMIVIDKFQLLIDCEFVDGFLLPHKARVLCFETNKDLTKEITNLDEFFVNEIDAIELIHDMISIYADKLMNEQCPDF